MKPSLSQRIHWNNITRKDCDFSPNLAKETRSQTLAIQRKPESLDKPATTKTGFVVVQTKPEYSLLSTGPELAKVRAPELSIPDGFIIMRSTLHFSARADFLS